MRSVATGDPETRVDQEADQDLELLLLIRHFELALLDLYERGELNGTTHTCLGQEIIPVAVSALLRDGDHVFSNHRGHGHYLARFRDPYGLLAEIMGRAGAVCGGVGGSQHIRRPGYLSTGVQGESLPVAVGTALHLRRADPGALACAYIGDGTWGEGAVYEALNLASLWQLPLLVIVEHNGIAQSTLTSASMAGTIADRAKAFGITHIGIDSTDIPTIRDLLRPLLDEVRAGHPVVAEVRTHRLGPHSKGDDSRAPEMIRAALDHDWYAARSDDRFRELDTAARGHIATVVAEVRGRPPVSLMAA
jgi:acetoin:2,6-dichlorophenolindophenol oxidoreductase subunit alpha